MKYKSELIHEILGQRGHEKSTLHYQSECMESWVDETKGAYPKLCDYESEWLNYIYENPIGEFPYETVSTNSMTTVNNVVPFEYKSAILRGKTENICDRFEQGSYSFSSSLGTVTPSGASNDRLRIKQPITGVSGMLIITLNDKYEMLSAVQDKDGKVVSTNWSTVTTNNLVETDKFYFSMRKKDGSGITPNDLYEGIISVTGYDLFEMKTVQMPVLTTSNEDGTKTNTLTVNEDVTLRGIGDVQDTLDCLTGEVTKRIEEIILDGGGDEQWFANSGGSSTHQRFVLKRGNRKKPISNVSENLFLCDKFNTVNTIKGENSKEMCLMEESDGWYLSIIIAKTKLNSVTVNGFKSWLQSNNVKMQYVVESESIKTVDLTVFNQDGEPLSKIKPIEGTMHIEVSGTPIAPTAVLEVPVEAITQNLNSFIEEE